MELVDAMTVGALTERGREALPSASEHQRKELSERYQVWPGGASDRNIISISKKEKKKNERTYELKMAPFQN